LDIDKKELKYYIIDKFNLKITYAELINMYNLLWIFVKNYSL